VEVKQVDSRGLLGRSEFIQGYWRLADWGMNPQQRLAFLQAHIELGVSVVDHADIYGDYRCEQLFGEALRLQPNLREKLQIVSKCNIKLCSDHYPERRVKHYDSSKEHILKSVENSLKRFYIDSLDVLLLHRMDFLMDADEVAEAFMLLHQQGKVKHFGVSNFSPAHFDLLQSRLDRPLVTNQVEINPLNTAVIEGASLDHCQQHKIRPMAWSCLAGGRIFYEQTERVLQLRQCLSDIQQEVGADNIEQVIYAWVRMLPAKPLVIIGSGNIERVRSAIGSAELTLTREQWYRVWVAAKGCDVP